MTLSIYFIKPIGLSGPIKIGCSAAPKNRLQSLSVWSPFPLEILISIDGTRKLETNIHACLARSHSHREWFHSTDEVVSLIEKLRAGFPIEKAIDLSLQHGSIRPKGRSGWTETSRLKASYSRRIRRVTWGKFFTPEWIDDFFRFGSQNWPLTSDDRERLEAFISTPHLYCQAIMPHPLNARTSS